jgi:catechol 2,3-dioxygenase
MHYGISPPAYRLPGETHLGAARLLVSDLERSLEYYQQVLGLRVLWRERTSAALGASGGGLAPIINLETRPGTKPPPRGGRYGLYHFALLLPDRASLGRLVRHLGELGAHVASADHAVSEALYLWDPDGLGIEVYSDRPRAEWRVRDREIFMTTERLNMQSLLTAGGDEPWTGIPHGTSLGHMHLQVSDLDTAEAFFHSALGLDKIVWNFPGALFMSAGGYHHHLGTNTWATGAGHALEDEARLLEWEIVLPSSNDRTAAAQSLRAAGYAAEQEGESWVVSDPWNTTLRLR